MKIQGNFEQKIEDLEQIAEKVMKIEENVEQKMVEGLEKIKEKLERDENED